jgi:hypothetical protein
MYDFDDDEIVVSGAGGTNYVRQSDVIRIKAGKSPQTPAGKRVVAAAKKADKDKAKKKAATGKKGVAGGRRKPTALKPKGKRKPMARG